MKVVRLEEEVLGRWRLIDSIELALRKAAEKRTLYVSRFLHNYGEVWFWAKANGFKEEDLVPDPHVTVIHSSDPVDWSQFIPDKEFLFIGPQDDRSVTTLGSEGAVVLKFSSDRLQQRHDEFVKGGASHDFESYIPHVTLTYAGLPDRKITTAYPGQLVFGPEYFAEIIADKDLLTGLVAALKGLHGL